MIILEGLRIFKNSVKKKIRREEHSGSAEEICRKIIDKCWNEKKEYFMVSNGNFSQFWARDFGMCIESLIHLGYKDKVRLTLKYAMDKYRKTGRITTQITPKGKPIDFPSFTPESASYMLNSLLILNDKKLIEENQDLFKKIAKKIRKEDVKAGFLRKDKTYSSMKDHSNRISDCYNNCFLYLFSQNLKKIGVYELDLQVEDFKAKFWTGKYFKDDLSGHNVCSSDANVYPYWTGLIKDKKMLDSSIEEIRKRKLDKPYPLKYTRREDIKHKFHFADMLVSGYERDTSWVHLGMNYLEIVGKTDVKLLKEYLKVYEKLILKHKNFLEVYDSNGKPFSRLLYESDENMLWSCIWLSLKTRYASL